MVAGGRGATPAASRSLDELGWGPCRWGRAADRPWGADEQVVSLVAFEAALRSWLAPQLSAPVPLEPIAIDGKAVRGAKTQPLPGGYLLSAFASRRGAVLAQLAFCERDHIQAPEHPVQRVDAGRAPPKAEGGAAPRPATTLGRRCRTSKPRSACGRPSGGTRNWRACSWTSLPPASSAAMSRQLTSWPSEPCRSRNDSATPSS
jgi:hypothetical protein